MEFCVKLLSLPLWERGLKFDVYAVVNSMAVAPLVGAWIEIHKIFVPHQTRCMSLPLWERGLK